MLIFVVRRLLQAIPVVFLASVGVFLMLHLLPGDPALMMAGGDASPEIIASVREDLGLNQPLPVQYVIWVEHVLRGDPVYADDPCDPVNEHARLAAAGAREHERGAVRRRDGGALRLVQRIDDIGNVHGRSAPEEKGVRVVSIRARRPEGSDRRAGT